MSLTPLKKYKHKTHPQKKKLRPQKFFEFAETTSFMNTTHQIFSEPKAARIIWT